MITGANVNQGRGVHYVKKKCLKISFFSLTGTPLLILFAWLKVSVICLWRNSLFVCGWNRTIPRTMAHRSHTHRSIKTIWSQSQTTAGMATHLYHRGTYKKKSLHLKCMWFFSWQFALFQYRLVFYVNNEHIITDITIINDHWHHICFLWAMQFGYYSIYVDSQLVLEGRNLSKSIAVSPNGTLILGQDQDQQGAGFARTESYSGLITHVYVWSKRLREAEIKALFSDCSGPTRLTVRPDHLLIAWADFRIGIEGNVQILTSNFCKLCGLPETTDNGYTTSNGQNSGARVQWHCDPNFELEGNREGVCLKTGEWSATKPTCVGK